MRWLCRLVTPPGGLVLDPFAGSGTTGVASLAEGMQALLIEQSEEYVGDICRRLDMSIEQATAASVAPRPVRNDELGPLFGAVA